MRALILSGGGARGAYQVGVLKALANLCPPKYQPFPIITGLSVGALNACVLATEPDDFPAAARKLESIWRNLDCHQVFNASGPALRGRLRQWAGGIFLGWTGMKPPPSLLDASPLLDLLSRHVDFDVINSRVGKSSLRALGITASSYASGTANTFFQGDLELIPWTRSRRRGQRTPLTPQHVLASSALPFIFPAVRIGSTWYGDGALREAAPLSAAIHLGATQIFSIGARDNVPDPEPNTWMEYPSTGYLAGQTLDILFNDNIDADIERAQRINSTLSLLTSEQAAQITLRPIGISSINPSRDIRPIAGAHANELPGAFRVLLRTIGAMSEPWVLPSYLTFESGYINALIDLGEQDALAKWSGESPPFVD